MQITRALGKFPRHALYNGVIINHQVKQASFRDLTKMLITFPDCSREKLRLFTTYPENPEILAGMHMVRQFCLNRPENFWNKRNVLKDSPKFSAEISEWKM